MTDIFELAARKKYRFSSARGELTVEQLWDLPLLAGSKATRDVKVDLDTIARGINAELKSIDEGSFVKVSPDPRKPELTTKLEIVKHIIGTLQAEDKARTDAAAKAAEKSKLLDALARKQDDKIESMSEDEIRKAIDALSA